jgi:hypothetical protein
MMGKKSETERYDEQRDLENFRGVQKRLGREKPLGFLPFGKHNFTIEQWQNLSPEAKRYLIDTLIETLTAGPSRSYAVSDNIERT